jgi:hypothetical protein
VYTCQSRSQSGQFGDRCSREFGSDDLPTGNLYLALPNRAVTIVANRIFV